MSHPRAPHWASLSETTWVFGIRFLLAVHGLFGRWPFRLCAFPVVFCHWLFNATARRASMQYLERLQAHAQVFDTAPGWRHSLRHFFVFAETLLDKLLAISGRYPGERITRQRAVMLEQIARGEGGVIVTAHMGCLELCRALAAHVPGLRLIVLVHTAHAERFNQLMQRFSPDDAVQLVQVTALDPATAMRLGEQVAKGAFVAIAGDRVPVQGSRHVVVPFLGRPAPFPVGPYILASTLGCSLFAMGCTHRDAGYAIDFVKLADSVRLPRQSREAALTACAADFAVWLEQQVLAAPYDWFNFFPFWNQMPHDLPHP